MKKIFRKIKSKVGEEYNVILVFNEGKLTEQSSCDCIYWSFYAQSEKNKKAKKTFCRHIIKAYAEERKIDNQSARNEIIKLGLMNPNHLRRI